MGERVRRIKDFFLREKEPDVLPRAYLAEAVRDLFEQMDGIVVIKLTHDNMGPLGGESSHLNAIYDGHWITVNIYGN